MIIQSKGWLIIGGRPIEICNASLGHVIIWLGKKRQMPTSSVLMIPTQNFWVQISKTHWVFGRITDTWPLCLNRLYIFNSYDAACRVGDRAKQLKTMGSHALPQKIKTHKFGLYLSQTVKRYSKIRDHMLLTMIKMQYSRNFKRSKFLTFFWKIP